MQLKFGEVQPGIVRGSEDRFSLVRGTSRRAIVNGGADTMAMKIIGFNYKTLPNIKSRLTWKWGKFQTEILCKIADERARGVGRGTLGCRKTAMGWMQAFAPFSHPCGISAQHAFDPIWHLVSLRGFLVDNQDTFFVVIFLCVNAHNLHVQGG